MVYPFKDSELNRMSQVGLFQEHKSCWHKYYLGDKKVFLIIQIFGVFLHSVFRETFFKISDLQLAEEHSL